MIRLDGVRKVYPDGTVAVDHLDLAVARGELVALVGPSGCGKSTTLRMVNRLVTPTSGRIEVDGVDAARTDPVQLRRRIGYVIQRVGLFPHQDVATNVATVPALLGWDRTRIRARVDELLELVGLPPDTYRRRYPHELSGGQQQRVGVARALAADPPVLLMDEPFGAVDPQARGRLQEEFDRIRRELGTTVLLVTHDVDEAVRLADRMAVFAPGGRLEQVGPPAAVLAAPAGEGVAAFLGRDTAVRRMTVVRLEASDLDDDPRPGVDGATSPLPEGAVLGERLSEVFARLAAAPQGWVPVRDGEGRPVGVATPASLHRALRREAAAAATPAAGAVGTPPVAASAAPESA